MKCMKKGCVTDLDGPAVIKVKMPVVFENKILDFYLCRIHFLKADSLNAQQFREWVHKEAKE